VSTLLLIVIIAAGTLVVLGAAIFALTRGSGPVIAEAAIVDKEDHTTMDPETRAVRSTQAADLKLPAEALDAIWTPSHLERLARTYWRFLTRCTLGVIRVKYTEEERYVCVVFRPFVLLSFKQPEYAMDGERGIVRWRIDKGFLVSRASRSGDGYLQIDIKRSQPDDKGRATLHVEVEVANFYPSIASGVSSWVYTNTQSRIHVIVTHGFLRSLVRLDLAQSRVGRFAQDTLPEGELDNVPDPPLPKLEAEPEGDETMPAQSGARG
jgi:hypothetical protein